MVHKHLLVVLLGHLEMMQNPLVMPMLNLLEESSHYYLMVVLMDGTFSEVKEQILMVLFLVRQQEPPIRTLNQIFVPHKIVDHILA